MTLVADPILTSRLRLDPLVADDAAGMLSVYSDPRMFEFTGGTPPSRDDLALRYERLAVGRSPDGDETWLNWIVRLRGRTTPIGTVQATLEHASGMAWVAWEIGVPWQRRGFAGEAATALVSWLQRHRVTLIEAAVHPQHVSSQAVARRAGLEPTGRVIDGEQVWAGPVDGHRADH